MHRTHTCGELRKSNVNARTTLAGWVHRRRDHGGLIFIDLRDRFGVTQIVFDPQKNAQAHQMAETLKSEWVIKVDGKVVTRAEGMANPRMSTGDIEVEAENLEILSRAKTPPFSISDETINVNEELRLKYRYLDIRRGLIAQKLLVRHKALQASRQFLSDQNFIEIATPMLGRSTPEGSRDYLVPSRITPGHFYALPQSPQLYKQILMVAGMDRYFQIATCLRDEDLRANRQPEFTQIDLEMSFGTPEDLFPIIERLVCHIFKTCKDIEIPAPFRRMTYLECVETYGTDKPDLRFDLHLVDLREIAERSSFTIFHETLASGGIVKGFRVPKGASLTRRDIDQYTEFVGDLGIKGLAWIKYTDDAVLQSSIVKFFDDSLQKELIQKMEISPGDLIFMIADEKSKAHQALDHLRRRVARDRNLINEEEISLLWVTDFPLFAWNSEEKRIESEHHPFTQPHPDDLEAISTNPLSVRSSSYDLVLNGHEVASGSQRIHDSELQEQIFQVLNISPEDQKIRFGFFLESLSYGTPPHLGIALGFDRIIMVLTGTENIRDVIAFPKSSKASDLMTEAPSPVEDEQLLELCVKLDIPPKINWSS
ncbi:MAG: aspartate--tRNA ligase [Chlamydiales bacterium]